MKTIIMKPNEHGIARAVRVLRRGGLVIYPTETAYGIGADFTNARAVAKVHRLKKRAKTKMLPVIVGSTSVIKHYAEIDKNALKLSSKFMPGPLTLVSHTKIRRTIAWRIPGYWIALEIAKRFGKPITSTSANISGNAPLYKFCDAKKLFDGKVDIIIDGGNLPRRRTSTIFDLNSFKILRKGPISKKSIFAALNRGR